MLRRVWWRYESVLVGPQEEDSRIGEEGLTQGRDRPPFRRRSRYGQALLQATRRVRHPRTWKGPRQGPKLDEKATKLLMEDLEERPWATHSQRAEFLFALSGVSVSEATVCRDRKSVV